MKRAARAIAAAVVVGLWSSSVGAQSSEKDADAERFFREGQKLMEERRYGEACPKFEAAYKKDQQLGTLLNLAYCHKEQGAIWQAWVEFKEAEVKAVELQRRDRRDFARQRMTELEKSLARVVIESQQRVELTEVLVEDRRVPDAEKRVTFAAEPGQRKLTFRAKGKKQVVQLVTIVKGERPQRITVPPMVDEEKEPVVVAEAPPSHAEEPKTPPPQPRPPEASEGSGRKTLTFALVGVGVVGVGVGTVTGLMTLSNACSKSARADNPDGCPPGSQVGRDRAAEGELTGLVSTIAFGVGGAALLTALVLYFTEPSDPSAAVGAAPKRARTSLRVVPELGAGWAGLRGAF
ncbi:MAG: hypothetical protein KF764_28455 [Labilithrix sp.]|nr:hypothetical protein [Labilithrix sp.]